jgi:branched-chain amino acid transport system substrate-binding protein
VFRKPKALSGVALVALIVALAACSSSSKSSTSNSTSATQSTTGSTSVGATGTTGAPIKVGLICSCSGPFGGAVVPGEDVYKAWVNTVNGSGGIDGHPIQLLAKDDATNPGTSATIAQGFLSQHVDAIVDLSNVGQTWASAAQAANVPVVGANLNELPFFMNPDFYAEGQTTDSATLAYVLTVKAAGVPAFADFYCSETPDCAQFLQAIKTNAQQQGVPLSYSAEIAGTAPNYTAQCVAAQQKNLKGLLVEDGATIIVRVAADCDRQGWDPAYFVGGGSYSTLFTTAPGIKTNLWSYYPDLPFWVNTPAVQAMNTAVDKYYPGLRNNANLWNEEAVYSWPAALLLEDAVKAGGLTAGATPSPAEIVKGLEALRGDTLDGWSPPLTFAAGKPHPVDCWFLARVQNGTPSLENNGKVTCENGSS